MADLDLGMLVGFGHTPYPIDHRTKAMVARDVERFDAVVNEE
jgi:hypothetical protein